MVNLAKGFTIMILLAVLSTVLGDLANVRLSLHLRLPIPIAQLGIVRLSNVLSLSICVFVLLLANFSLFPPQLKTKAITATLWTMPLFCITSSLMLILTDLIQYSKRIKAEQILVFLLLFPLSAFLILTNYQDYLFNLSSLHLLGFYILSIALLLLSTYTFTRQRS